MVPTAVIFDMDGLMIDTEQMMRPCFQRAAADLGFLVEDDFYATLVGLGTADCRRSVTLWRSLRWRFR